MGCHCLLWFQEVLSSVTKRNLQSVSQFSHSIVSDSLQPHGLQQQLELDMEQQTGSKSGKEYIMAVYCHPAYLTYMQSTS